MNHTGTLKIVKEEKENNHIHYTPVKFVVRQYSMSYSTGFPTCTDTAVQQNLSQFTK